MKFLKSTIAALAIAAVGTAAFAQERTVVRESPNGTVVEHIHRAADRDNWRAERMAQRRHEEWRRMHAMHREARMERVKVVRRVVWTDHRGNQHVRRVVEWRSLPVHGTYAVR